MQDLTIHKGHYVCENYFFDSNVVTQKMVHIHLKANTMYLLILPSDGDICRGATDRQQANHTCFESWLLFSLWCTKWIKKKEHKTNYLCILLTAYKVVPELVCGSLSMMSKTVNTTGIILMCLPLPPCAKLLLQYPLCLQNVCHNMQLQSNV